MRSPHTPKLHLPSRVAQICRFTSQPHVREARQRRTSLTFYDLPGDLARFSVLENSYAERCCRTWLGSALRTTRPATGTTTGLPGRREVARIA